MKLFNIYHLKQVEETFWQHFKFGLWASAILFLISVTSLIHALFPFFLARTPDKLYKYFISKSQQRLQRIDKLLKDKDIE